MPGERLMPDGTPPGIGAETAGGNQPPLGGENRQERPLTIDEIFDPKNTNRQVRVGDLRPIFTELLQSQAALEARLSRGGSPGYDTEVLLGKKATEFEQDIPSYRQYPFRKFEVPDGANADQRKEILVAKTEAQIRWIEGLMVKLETSPYSMSVMLQRPENQGIVVRLSELTEDASDYLAYRLNVEKARQVRDIGGSAENFLQLGGLIGQADVMQGLLSRPGIARAYSLIEQNSNQNNKAEENYKLSFNPAYADPIQWGKINQELASIVAKEIVEENNYGITDNNSLVSQYHARLKAKNPQAEIRELSEEEIEQLKKNEKARVLYEETEIQLRHVKQASAFWRMHMRAALENGLVFKPLEEVKKQYPNLTEEQYTLIQEELRYLPVEERRANWDRFKNLVLWKKSIAEGTREDCVQRIIHGGFYLEQFQRGEAILRPGIVFGAQDFLSNFLTRDFLTQGKNFTDGVAFKEIDEYDNPYENPPDNPQETSFINEKGQKSVLRKRVFIKFRSDGKKEKLILHSNGVLEVDSKYGFDLAKINWLAKGLDCYTGRYAAYNIKNADKMRDNVSSPDKIAYDPSVKGIVELYGSVEHLTHIERARGRFVQEARDKGKLMADGRIEDKEGNNISQEKWIQKRFAEERAKGTIYREDIYAMLIEGLLRYEKSEQKARTGAKNISLEEADRIINSFRGRKMLTDEQAKKLKRTMLEDYTGYNQALGSLNWLGGANNLVDNLQSKGLLPSGLAEKMKSTFGHMSTLSEDAFAKVLYDSIIIWQRDEPQFAIMAMFFKILQEGFSGALK